MKKGTTVNAGTKRSKSAKARANFKSWIETGVPEVIDKKTGSVFHKDEDEMFLESPILNKKFGKNRYYISNKGRLISFAKNPDHPLLIAVDRYNKELAEKKERKKGKKNRPRRDSYNIGDNFHEYTYRLVAEAFGVYAFGLATKKDKVHHTRKYIQEKGLYFNNDPDYLEYVTEEVHKLLNRLQESQGRERTLIEEVLIMMEISRLSAKEEPDKITVFMDGPDNTSAFTMENSSITFTERGRRDFEDLNKTLYNMMRPEPEKQTDMSADKNQEP